MYKITKIKKTTYKKRIYKKRTNATINQSLVQAFRMTVTGINEPPLPGTIRMLVKKDLPDYLRIPFYSHDRTITEWQTLFESYKSLKYIPQRAISADEPYNAFFHYNAVGVLLQTEYRQQMKLRWIVQRWIYRIRERIYRRRIVGETDLRTLEPIMNKDAIQVICHRTKSIYRFHIHSIIRMIKENLYFEQWGRADPMNPRNPYTNQPWLLHQLVELIHQIQILLVDRREILPSFLSKFVEARYSVEQFHRMYQLELGIAATTRFFQTPESRIVRSELLQQLFHQIQIQCTASLYRQIRQKHCPPFLQQCWETLIQNKWIHDNYGYSPRYMWRDILEQTITIQRLYQKTVGILSPQEPSSSGEDGPDSS